MRMHLRSKLVFILLVLVFIAGLLVKTTKPAYAVGTLPNTPWWKNGDGYYIDCDYTYFSIYSSPRNPSYVLSQWIDGKLVQGVWNGLKACGPKPGSDGGDYLKLFYPNHTGELEFQCTELVKRYLYLAFNVPPLSNADGSEIVTRYVTTYPETFDAIDNASNYQVGKQVWPKIGDVISFYHASDINHTAIITNVQITDAVAGDATLTIFEQNWDSTNNNFRRDIHMVGWVIQSYATGWLTPVWSNPAFTTTSGQLYSIVANSSTDIWAIGQKSLYKYDGSSWSLSSIPGGAYNTNSFKDIVPFSASNAIAVGSWTNTYPITYPAALAMEYLDGTWLQISTQFTGSNSTFESVDGDLANNNIWAVGYTLATLPNGNNYHPLFEKYVPGTGFVAVQDPFPNFPGSTEEKVFDVSVYSDTNAWAVGHYVASAKTHAIAVYYGGTTWNTQAIVEPSGTQRSTLTGVVAIAPDNVWATGFYALTAAPNVNLALILHWDGTTWNIIPVTPSVTGDSYVPISITVAEDGVVYVVGKTALAGYITRPLVLKFTYNVVTQVYDTTQVYPNFGPSFLNDVVVVGGNIYTVGQSGSNTSIAVGPKR